MLTKANDYLEAIYARGAKLPGIKQLDAAPDLVRTWSFSACMMAVFVVAVMFVKP